jgi:hypothetical protein
MSGDCRFGDRCNFAHGEHELRSLPPRSDDFGRGRGGFGGPPRGGFGGRGFGGGRGRVRAEAVVMGASLYYHVTASYVGDGFISPSCSSRVYACTCQKHLWAI